MADSTSLRRRAAFPFGLTNRSCVGDGSSFCLHAHCTHCARDVWRDRFLGLNGSTLNGRQGSTSDPHKASKDYRNSDQWTDW